MPTARPRGPECKPCARHSVHINLCRFHYDPWRWGRVYTHLKDEDAKAQGGRIPDPAYCVTWSKTLNLSEHQFLICEAWVRMHPLHGAFVKNTTRGQPAPGQVRRTHRCHPGAGCEDLAREQHTGRAGLHGAHPEVAQPFPPTPRLTAGPACALRERGQPVRPR